MSDTITFTVARADSDSDSSKPGSSSAAMQSIWTSGAVVDPNASSTNIRRGKGWRKSRVKLRSWLMLFQDWGSV